MARVTVEDCILKVDDRFELVLLAAHRARMIFNGEEATIDRDNDKPPVIALREIADETISIEELKENVIKSYQLYLESDEANEEAEAEAESESETDKENNDPSSVESKENEEPVQDMSDNDQKEDENDLKTEDLNQESLKEEANQAESST